MNYYCLNCKRKGVLVAGKNAVCIRCGFSGSPELVAKNFTSLVKPRLVPLLHILPTPSITHMRKNPGETYCGKFSDQEEELLVMGNRFDTDCELCMEAYDQKYVVLTKHLNYVNIP